MKGESRANVYRSISPSKHDKNENWNSISSRSGASNQLCYYFLLLSTHHSLRSRMKTCGNMPFPNLCCSSRGGEIYGRQGWMPSKIVCSDPSVSRPRPLARQTIMQKLELCPKIKLNKSLLSSLHFSPPRSVPSSSCLSSPLFFSLSSQSEKKNIFTIFHIDGIARCCIFLFLLFFFGELFSHCSPPWHW